MELLINILLKVEIYILFIVALNSLMLGKLDLWSIGNIVYFSIGAFITGYLSNTLSVSGFSLYLLFIIVPILVSIVSLLFFRISNILKEDFFLFFSIFIIELNFVFNNILAGPSGYSHIKRPALLNSDLSLLLLVFFLLLLIFIWIYRFYKSRLNKIYSVIRNNQILAQSIGINIPKKKLPLFIASAVISGLAGVLFAFYSYGADPTVFSTNEIIILFTLILFSGIDSVKGSIIAGFLYVFLSFFFNSVLSNSMQIIAPKISQIIFGALLILIPFVLPKGLFGKRNI